MTEFGARRTLILGDSWIRGLGTSKRTFGRMLAKRMGTTDVLDLSAISRTSPDIAQDHLDEIRAYAPHIAILCLGGADSLIFPAWWVQRLIDRIAPPHWHGLEGMMPIALYSRSRGRRFRQRVEQTLKSLIKQIVINLFGGRRRVTPAEFADSFTAIMTCLADMQTSVIVVGLASLDGWYSPKANASVRETDRLVEEITGRYPNATYVATTTFLTKWDDYLPDHVHLRVPGHVHMTEGVLAALTAAGGPWRDLIAENAVEGLAASASNDG